MYSPMSRPRSATASTAWLTPLSIRFTSFVPYPRYAAVLAVASAVLATIGRASRHRYYGLPHAGKGRTRGAEAAWPTGGRTARPRPAAGLTLASGLRGRAEARLRALVLRTVRRRQLDGDHRR